MKKLNRQRITGTENRTFENILFGYDDRFQKIVEEIQSNINDNNKVLDIGCGEAKIWKLFPKAKVYGLDVSKYNLKKLGKNIIPVYGNAERLPFKDKTFDLVIASEILEHLLRPDNALLEISRVLKNGGKAIITFPNTAGIQFRLSVFLTGMNPALNYPINSNHIRFFNFNNFKFLIKQTSLKIFKVRGSSFLAFHKENFGIYLPVPRALRVRGGDMFPSLSQGILVDLIKFSKN